MWWTTFLFLLSKFYFHTPGFIKLANRPTKWKMASPGTIKNNRSVQGIQFTKRAIICSIWANFQI